MTGGQGLPGQVLRVAEDGLTVAAAEGAVHIGTVQPETKKAQPAHTWAQAAGVQVVRCTRCAAGPVIGQTLLRSAGTLSAPQARVELMLALLA